MASNWALYRCQQASSRSPAARRAGCACSTAAAAPLDAAAAPAITPSWLSRRQRAGGLRITEQGEMISAKFADPERARQNLEALVAATFDATCCDGRRTTTRSAVRRASRTKSPTCRRRAYRRLVYETPGFVDWFRAITPLDELTKMNIGRGRRRAPARGRIEDLRAIPWVFSWSQCRLMLPGWFGVGTAVDEWAGDDHEPLAELQRMHAEWPWFRTVVSATWRCCWPRPTSTSPRATKRSRPTCRRRRVLRDRRRRARTCGVDRDGCRATTTCSSTTRRSPWQALPHPVHRSAQPPAGQPARAVARRRPSDLIQRGIQLTINGVATGLRNSG